MEARRGRAGGKRKLAGTAARDPVPLPAEIVEALADEAAGDVLELAEGLFGSGKAVGARAVVQDGHGVEDEDGLGGGLGVLEDVRQERDRVAGAGEAEELGGADADEFSGRTRGLGVGLRRRRPPSRRCSRDDAPVAFPGLAGAECRVDLRFGLGEGEERRSAMSTSSAISPGVLRPKAIGLSRRRRPGGSPGRS